MGPKKIMAVVAIIIVIAAALVGLYYYFFYAGQTAVIKSSIIIGAQMSLTGPASAQGRELSWTVTKAVDDVNKGDGVYVAEYGKKLPISLIILDDESNSDKAAELVEKFVKVYNVDFLIAGHGGPYIMPFCVAAEKYKVLTMVTFITPETFFTQNFTHSCLFFFNTTKHVSLFYKMLIEANAPTTIGIVSVDILDGRILAGVAKKVGISLGFTVVAEEYYPTGSTDFTSIIMKFKDAKVDHVWMLGGTPAIVAFLRQSKELGYNWKALWNLVGSWPIEFYQTAGKDGEYVIADGFFYKTLPYPGARELWDAFEKHFGKFSIGGPGPHYALVQILVQAIEKAGTLKKDKVMKTILEEGPWETVKGPAKFDPKTHYAPFDTMLFQWINGTVRCVYPPEYAEARLVYPAPPWSMRS
ncbi:MAG: amino acid ABC transporter substrate-binding protein [Candidatus Bathyarchaeia archaeon]